MPTEAPTSDTEIKQTQLPESSPVSSGTTSSAIDAEVLARVKLEVAKERARDLPGQYYISLGRQVWNGNFDKPEPGTQLPSREIDEKTKLAKIASGQVGLDWIGSYEGAGRSAKLDDQGKLRLLDQWLGYIGRRKRAADQRKEEFSPEQERNYALMGLVMANEPPKELPNVQNALRGARRGPDVPIGTGHASLDLIATEVNASSWDSRNLSSFYNHALAYILSPENNLLGTPTAEAFLTALREKIETAQDVEAVVSGEMGYRIITAEVAKAEFRKQLIYEVDEHGNEVFERDAGGNILYELYRWDENGKLVGVEGKEVRKINYEKSFPNVEAWIMDKIQGIRISARPSGAFAGTNDDNFSFLQGADVEIRKFSEPIWLYIHHTFAMMDFGSVLKNAGAFDQNVQAAAQGVGGEAPEVLFGWIEHGQKKTMVSEGFKAFEKFHNEFVNTHKENLSSFTKAIGWYLDGASSDFQVCLKMARDPDNENFHKFPKSFKDAALALDFYVASCEAVRPGVEYKVLAYNCKTRKPEIVGPDPFAEKPKPKWSDICYPLLRLIRWDEVRTALGAFGIRNKHTRTGGELARANSEIFQKHFVRYFRDMAERNLEDDSDYYRFGACRLREGANMSLVDAGILVPVDLWELQFDNEGEPIMEEYNDPVTGLKAVNTKGRPLLRQKAIQVYEDEIDPEGLPVIDPATGKVHQVSAKGYIVQEDLSEVKFELLRWIGNLREEGQEVSGTWSRFWARIIKLDSSRDLASIEKNGPFARPTVKDFLDFFDKGKPNPFEKVEPASRRYRIIAEYLRQVIVYDLDRRLWPQAEGISALYDDEKKADTFLQRKFKGFIHRDAPTKRFNGSIDSRESLVATLRDVTGPPLQIPPDSAAYRWLIKSLGVKLNEIYA